MKCYISTYYKYNNYGTKLQNFALLYTLEKNGFEVTTLGLKTIKDQLKSNIKKVLWHFPFNPKKENWKNDIIKQKKFRKFNRMLHIEYFSRKELFNINSKNAIAIAGSDQIWSPVHLLKNPNDIDLFFLKFIDKEKRYSYAPSFGVEKLLNSEKKIYIDNLKNFKKITVREEAGKKIIHDLINEKVEIMPDPVFLLSSQEWIKKLNLCRNKDDNYILLYFLGNISNEQEEKISIYANNKNCRVIKIAGNELKDNEILPDPIEFLNLILNAQVIFTDSFHASCFSIIFNKKFFVYKRNDVKQFSRIDTLLKKYNLKIAIVEKDIIDYTKLDNKEILNQERIKGLNYLKSIKEERIVE